MRYKTYDSPFSLQDEQVADFYRAMALPIRVAIIRMLVERKDWMHSKDFIGLPAHVNLIAKHLYSLREIGLLKSQRRSNVLFYKLDEDNLKQFSNQSIKFLNLIETLIDRS